VFVGNLTDFRKVLVQIGCGTSFPIPRFTLIKDLWTRFGGYGGFQKFVSAGTAELSSLEEEVTDFSEVWNRSFLHAFSSFASGCGKY